jgi:hypothetical protein
MSGRSTIPKRHSQWLNSLLFDCVTGPVVGLRLFQMCRFWYRQFRFLGTTGTVRHRSDADGSISTEILVVAAPGPSIADPALLDFKRLRAGVRIAPGGKAFRPR